MRNPAATLDEVTPAPDNARMIVCKRVTYTGRVQGVGFRYTARQVAEGFAVTGYVRNLPGGAVDLVAEGPTDEVEQFLAALAQRMTGYIQQTRVLDESPSGYADFQIRP